MSAYQSILLITSDPLADIKKHYNIDADRPDIDTLVIVPEPTIGIETIRTLKSFTSRRPLKSTTKSVILLDAQLLTIEAQNALLKLLEEPPDYLTIILAAPYTHTFLDTILSRCEIIRADTSTTAIPTETKPQLNNLLSVSPAARLAAIPLDTKVRSNATNYCKQLINEAQQALHQHPSAAHIDNLQILTDCLTQLTANANPTIALTDAILRLQGETSLATMAKLPEKKRELD